LDQGDDTVGFTLLETYRCDGLAKMVEGRPKISSEEVPSLVALFGLPVDGLEVKDLPSYEDLNFRVKIAAGECYVLKAHNSALPSGTRARLEAQNRFITRLHDNGLPVPKVVVGPSGDSIVPLDAQASASPLVRMLTYLEGDIIPNETPKDEAFFRGVGETVGRVATALAGYEDADAHWTWDWDMMRVHEVVRGKLRFIADEGRRALATRYADEYAAVMEGPSMANLPRSIIHADLNDTNLLFKGSDVVGILDFGDSIHSVTVFDPAIAAGYYSLGQEDPLAVFREVLRGYALTAPQPLTEAEREVFFHAARGRILLSVAFSAEYSSLEPDNEYIAHTAEPGWAVLEKLASVPSSEALSDLARAFG